MLLIVVFNDDALFWTGIFIWYHSLPSVYLVPVPLVAYPVNLLVVWIIPHIARSTAEGDLITNVLFYIYSSSFPYYDDVCDTRQVGPAFKSILK